MKMEWKQLTVEHCPNVECLGMLLIHPQHHEKKCSDCNKYFMQNNDYIECDEPKKCVYSEQGDGGSE